MMIVMDEQRSFSFVVQSDHESSTHARYTARFGKAKGIRATASKTKQPLRYDRVVHFFSTQALSHKPPTPSDP
jgi:hypothetical protein